jgi:hypothetical protein
VRGRGAAVRGGRAADSAAELADVFAKSPTFQRILVRLVEKSARVGVLEGVPAFFAKATDGARRAFCPGLYAVHTGDPQNAIRLLWKCSKHAEWKLPALELMFKVYSNPNRKYVWCETKPLATTNQI